MGIEKLLEELVRHEGGFVNHPSDPGGATKFGITEATLSHWRKQSVTEADVKALTVDEAKAIYTQLYYLTPKINQLSPILQPIIFDMAVNMGTVQAIKIAQRVFSKLGTPLVCDGVIGEKTLISAKAACNVQGHTEVIRNIVNARINFYCELVAKQPEKQVFLDGWKNRANDFL